MNRDRRILLAISLALATSFAWLAIPRSSPRADRPDAFDVTLVAPRGDVQTLNSIDVVFSDAMIPLGGRIRGKESVPLLISPSIPGSFTWIGSRTLSFIPRGEIPTGTRLRCRIPRGTRSYEGKLTVSDYIWEIVVDRPRLLRSVPDRGKMHGPGEPVYLLFNTIPAPTAVDSIRLTGPGGPVRLLRITPDSSAIAQILPEEERPTGAARILALRPERPFLDGQRYEIDIRPGVPFVGCDVPMKEPASFSFETYGVPAPRSVTTDLSGFNLALGGPVDPDILPAFLRFDPPIRKFRVLPRSGASVRIEADLRAGADYVITIGAGLTSLLGARLTGDASIPARAPHLWNQLAIVPAGGYIPRNPIPSIRIEGTNVDTVEVFGAWVDPDSIPERLVYHDRANRATLPRIARWLQPAETPDSARATHVALTRFGPSPKEGLALHLRVRARALFPEPNGTRKLLSDEALLQITDLGLSAMNGSDRGLAWVTSISSGKPVENAEVILRVPGNARPLWTKKSDGEGLVWLPGLSELAIGQGTPLVAQVRTAQDAAWLELPTYGIDRSGDPATLAALQHRVYVFTDRPLYRPGETVRWALHARRVGRDGVLAASVPSLHYTVLSPSGEKIDSGAIDLAAPGSGSGTYTIAADAPLGDYALQFQVPGGTEQTPIGGASFNVQEYRLPRFEARLEGPRVRAVSGSAVMIGGRFTYLGGGPLAGAPVRWTLSSHPDWTRPDGLWDFSFQDDRPRGVEPRGPSGGTMRAASGEGTLDSDGRIALPVAPDLSGLNEDQTYTIEVGARDIADRSAYDVVRFPAWRAAIRVGARARFAPRAEGEDVRSSETRERVEFAAVAVDSAGNPASGVSIRWTIEKRSWKTVRVRRIGSIFGYENVPQDSLLASGTLQSLAEAATFLWDPPGPGSYSLAVEATDREGRTTRARDMIYVSGPETASWFRDDGGWIELKPDKREYEPGDTARVLIPAPAVPTEGLVLVLDDGIQAIRRLPRVQGSPRVGIPLGGSFPPGISVKAILIGPTLLPEGRDARRRLPYHGWGTTSLDLRMDSWRLDVAVAPDQAAYEPGDSVRVLIQVRDAQGQPASGSAVLAVVDDAIFELSGEETVDPLRQFFEWRGSGISYSDVRFRLQLAPTGEKGELTPGGDGAGSGMGLRRRFTPTAHWDPNVPVGPDGRAIVRFRLADDLTRYRFRALAASGVDRFGYGEAKADVRKPILIELSTPRFAREGDRIAVAAAVRSHIEKAADVRLTASAVGAAIKGKSEYKLKVPAGGGTRAVFTLQDPGPDGIRLTLRAEGDGHQDAIEVTVPIDRPFLWDREFLSGRADPRYNSAIEVEANPSPAMGGLSTVVSPSMLGALDDAMAYTIHYPYGCLEQISSSLLGVVAKEAVLRHLGEDLDVGREDRDAVVAAAIEGVRECADSWRLQSWPSAQSPDASDYTAGYALYVATRARQAGLAFPRRLWDRLGEEADSRLRRLVSDPREGHPEILSRILRDGPWLLWSLSEADKLLPPDSMRVRLDTVEALYARRGQASLDSRLMLGLAMGNLSQRTDQEALRRTWPNLAANLIGDIRSQSVQRTGRHVWVRSSDPLWGDGIGGDGYGSDVRMTALFLRLLALASPSDPDLSGLVAWIIDHRQGRFGGWANQHLTALTLDLLVSTVADLEGPPSQVSVTLAIGSEFENFRFLPGRNAVSRRFTPMSNLVDPAGKKRTTALRLEADGRRTVYLSASLDSATPALDAPQREEGLIVDRFYVDRDGTPFPGVIPLGEPLFVHLAVVVSRDAKTLVVEDPLPGGMEALNLSFQNTPRVSMGRGPSTPEEEGGEGLEGEGDDGSASHRFSVGSGNGAGLWIVHRELHDRSVRLFAESVRAGVYHLYYPVIAAVAGEYRTPGTRAEMLYSPEIYAVCAPQTVTIERKR